MSETYPGQMLPELQEKTTVGSNDLFYMVSSNASKKIKGSNLKDQMKPSDYTGATSSTNGANGLVPQPTTSDVDRFLKGDGTWGDISYAVGEASGSIATFSDGSPLPMRSLKVSIEPQQDLHGYDAPWVGGAGKNKFNTTESSRVVDGVTFTVNDDGTVVANGTSDAAARSAFLIGMYTITDNTALLNGCPSGGGSNKFELMAFANNKAASDYGNGASLSTFSVGDTIQILAIVRAGYTASNLIFKPMIRLASVTDATFAPYSNECPISGWDEVNVSVASKNLVNWKWNTFNDGKMEIFLEGGTYTLSAESTLTNGNAYIRGTKPSGEYVSREELGLTDWGASSTSGVYYGGGGQQTYTFNVPNGGAKIEFGKLNNNGTINAQLEIGDTATTYEPYNGSTYTIDLDGTRYGGTLDVVSGVLKVIYGIKVYSGNSSEGWYADGTQSSSTYRMKASDVPSNIKLPSSNADAMSAISNQFIATSADNIFLGNEGIGIPTNGSYLTLYSSVYNTNDVSLWKTHLASNNLQVCYELATPQTYQLTAQQVKSLLGVNNVWADTGDVDVHYVRDLTITIDDILSRLEALEG